MKLRWKEAVAGERRVVLFGGEPGVGKTRLAAALAAFAYEEGGGVVLAGRCDEDLGVPYQPFVEALRHFVDHTPPEHLRDRLGRYGGELVRLLPEVAERLPDLAPPLRSDPETERYRLFDAVAGWLAAVSSEQPLLLVLDDLQWAAKPTLLLLRHVLHAAEPLRLLVVATYRDTDIGRGHPLGELLADLRRDTGVERIALSGLTVAGVVGYLEAASGHALNDEDDTALALAIHDETDGNPFFIREVLRHLAETGGIAERDGRWGPTVDIDRLGIPEGVRDVVGRRLSRLSDLANQALTAAAVIGTAFDVAVVGPVCGLDDDELLAALEEAEAARIVAEVPSIAPRYRFAHRLVRDTLYDELSAGRRARLHRRAAEAIESVHAGRLGEHLSALANHYSRAAAPAGETAGKAVGYAVQAGERALAQLAHDEAVAWYHRALDLIDGAGAFDEAARLDVLVALGEAQQLAERPRPPGNAAGGGPRRTAARADRRAGESGTGQHTGGHVQHGLGGRRRPGGHARSRSGGHRRRRLTGTGRAPGPPRPRTRLGRRSRPSVPMLRRGHRRGPSGRRPCAPQPGSSGPASTPSGRRRRFPSGWRSPRNSSSWPTSSTIRSCGSRAPGSVFGRHWRRRRRRSPPVPGSHRRPRRRAATATVPLAGRLDGCRAGDPRRTG